MYSDLSYYATAPFGESALTYLREHGGLRGLAQAVSASVGQSNVDAGLAWVLAHPLPADAPEDAVQARALVVAALNAAQAKLNSDSQSGTASPEYQQAAATYDTYKAKAYQSDMPSAFALSLANIFGSGGIFDLSKLENRVLVYGGAVLAAYVLLPRLVNSVGRAGGSKSW
jgi:hypothetical protein